MSINPRRHLDPSDVGSANKAVMFVCAVDGTWNTLLTA